MIALVAIAATFEKDVSWFKFQFKIFSFPDDEKDQVISQPYFRLPVLQGASKFANILHAFQGQDLFYQACALGLSQHRRGFTVPFILLVHSPDPHGHLEKQGRQGDCSDGRRCEKAE